MQVSVPQSPGAEGFRADALGGGRDGCGAGIQLEFHPRAAAAARPLLIRAALKPLVLLPCQNKLRVCQSSSSSPCALPSPRLCSHPWVLGSPPQPGHCPRGDRWSQKVVASLELEPSSSTKPPFSVLGEVGMLQAERLPLPQNELQAGFSSPKQRFASQSHHQAFEAVFSPKQIFPGVPLFSFSIFLHHTVFIFA